MNDTANAIRLAVRKLLAGQIDTSDLFDVLMAIADDIDATTCSRAGSGVTRHDGVTTRQDRTRLDMT